MGEPKSTMGTCSSCEQECEFGFVPLGASQCNNHAVHYFGLLNGHVAVSQQQACHHHSDEDHQLPNVEEIKKMKGKSFTEAFNMTPFGVGETAKGTVHIYGLDDVGNIRCVSEEKVVAQDWHPEAGDRVNIRFTEGDNAGEKPGEGVWHDGKVLTIPINIRNDAGELCNAEELEKDNISYNDGFNKNKNGTTQKTIEKDSSSLLGVTISKVSIHGERLSETERRKRMWRVQCPGSEVVHYAVGKDIQPRMGRGDRIPDAKVVKKGTPDFVATYGFVPFGACQRNVQFVSFYGLQDDKIVHYETEFAKLHKAEPLVAAPMDGEKKEKLRFVDKYGFKPFSCGQTSERFIRLFGLREGQLVYVEERMDDVIMKD